MLTLHWYNYELEFRQPFSIAHGTRTHTPVVYVEISDGKNIGFGEAALPPYLKETQQSVNTFLSKLNFAKTGKHLNLDSLLEYVQHCTKGNFAAKAAVDMALHDLYGKLIQKPLWKFWNLKKKTPFTTYTLTVADVKKLDKKLIEINDFKILKVKLTGKKDKELIDLIRNKTDKQICVDVNQGWNDKHFALEMIGWLKEKKIIFVEQPLSKNKKKDQTWLKEKSPLPIIGDESVQTFTDLTVAKDLFHGINIKLMKCGGLREAKRMIEKAKKLNLKVLLGCMSESSCGCAAAAQLSPLCDWIDLDGPLLIKNDPFTGLNYGNGKIILTDQPGIGVEKQ